MEKKMPFKIDVERSMIVTLLVNPELLLSLPLKKEHFHHRNHEIAFGVMLEMKEKGEAINPVTFHSRHIDAGGVYHEIGAMFSLGEYYSPLTAETLLKILAEEAAKRKIKRAYDDEKLAPKEFIEECKKIELEFIEVKRIKSLIELHPEYEKEYGIKKQRMAEKGSIGLITGYKCIDENCSFGAGELVVLGAKTSVGKSAFALNIAVNCAQYEQKVLFFSAEMNISELMHRIYAQTMKISATRFKYCDADESMKLVPTEIAEMGKNLKLIDAISMSGNDVERTIRQNAHNFKPELVVVDYLQYLKHEPTEEHQNNNESLGNVTKSFKRLAGELGCTFLVLSQVNRQTQGMPDLHNLRDSGNIEQNADTVIFLHREERQDTVAEFVIAKQRNGALFHAELNFNPPLTKFYEHQRANNRDIVPNGFDY